MVVYSLYHDNYSTIIFQAGGRELSNILNLLLSETIHNLLAFWSMKEIDRSVCNKCLKGTNNSSKYFWNRQLLFLQNLSHSAQYDLNSWSGIIKCIHFIIYYKSWNTVKERNEFSKIESNLEANLD